jgi:phosphohistidine phosphatase SixA
MENRMTAKILEALAKLDTANDNHWTKEGKPQLAALRLFAGDQALTQQAVDLASPDFSRPLSNQGESTSVTQNASVEGSAGAGKTDTQVEKSDEELSPKTAFNIAKKTLVEAEARKAASDQAYQAAITQVDKCIDALEKSVGKQTLATHLSDYYGRQKEIAAERVRRKEALKGIDIKELIAGKAPIDAAMARKTVRGGQRPVNRLG